MIIKIFIVCLFLGFSFQYNYAQGFKGIVPLKSTCEDVKRILQVKECTFPQSIYRLKDFHVIVNFTKDKPAKNDKICFKVPAGLVSSLTVSYNKIIPLTKFLMGFEYKVKYLEGPFGDIDTIAYGTEDGSVHVTENFGQLGYVSYIPTRKEYQELSYRCKSPDAGDDIEIPSDWFDRYWNLSPKKEKARMREITPVIKQTEENYGRSMQIYLVYYYSQENDKKSGLEQATRAKKYLELNGIKPEKIKIVNGGKEDKPEIVIYLQ